MEKCGLIKIVAIIAIVVALLSGAACLKEKIVLKKINEDVSYIANNVSYRVAPKDIKEKIDNIVTLSGGLKTAEAKAEKISK
jgi:hypothetical protein